MHSCTLTFTDISPLFHSESDTVKICPHLIQPPPVAQKNTLITKFIDISASATEVWAWRWCCLGDEVATYNLWLHNLLICLMENLRLYGIAIVPPPVNSNAALPIFLLFLAETPTPHNYFTLCLTRFANRLAIRWIKVRKCNGYNCINIHWSQIFKPDSSTCQQWQVSPDSSHGNRRLIWE